MNRADLTARPEDAGRQPGVLGVCVVNYRSHELIGRLIENLAGCRGATELRIACVDNSESDTEFQQLRHLEPRAIGLGICLTAIQSPRNVGYAAGNNEAARLLVAGGVDTLLVVNPDISVRAGTLDSLRPLVGGPVPAIYTVTTKYGSLHYSGLSRLNRWTSASALAGGQQRSGAVTFGRVIYPGGHFLAMSTSTWIRLRGLCEDFFLFGEEADLAVRALPTGMLIASTDLIEVEHYVGATTGATAVVARKSITTLRHASRSAVIFSRKHNPWRTPAVVLSRMVLAGVVLIRRGPTACLDVLGGIVAGLGATLTPPVVIPPAVSPSSVSASIVSPTALVTGPGEVRC